MNNKIFLLVFSLLFLSRCTNPVEAILPGKWIAYQVTEEGKPLEINAEEVQLEIRTDGTYSYASTLNYAEKGNWKVKDNLLITSGVEPEGSNNTVQVIPNAPDSLILKMQEEGKERMVYMVRDK